MFSITGASKSSRSCSSVSGMVSSLGCLASPATRTTRSSGLQVAVHEVDLLQPAKTLADVLRTDLAHALDGFQLRVRGGEQLVEAAELPHDLRDAGLRGGGGGPGGAGARGA